MCLIHDLADLLGVGLRQAAAEDGEVLAEDEDEAAADRAVAGDDAVTRHLLVGHAEVRRAVFDEHVPFLEAAGIEQNVDALARGERSVEQTSELQSLMRNSYAGFCLKQTIKTSTSTNLQQTNFK